MSIQLQQKVFAIELTSPCSAIRNLKQFYYLNPPKEKNLGTCTATALPVDSVIVAKLKELAFPRVNRERERGKASSKKTAAIKILGWR